MENEIKNLVLHFSDEDKVVSREFSLVNFNAFRWDVFIEHNEKQYEVSKRSLNVDSTPIVMDIYLELCKP